MTKTNFLIFTFCLYSCLITAQDLLSGIGSFDNENPLNFWTTTTNEKGSFTAITNESYFGTTSLKTEVTETNTADVTLSNTINFPISSGIVYTVSFYLKGKVGNEFSVALLNNTAEIAVQTDIVVIDEWTYYTYSFTSNLTSSIGKLKITFKEIGLYFIDELIIKAGIANRWYVSASGSNSNSGKSTSQPFKTINYAINNAWVSGDIVYVMNGTYKNVGFGNGSKNNAAIVSVNKSGTLNGPLVIKNYPNHKPKLEFDGSGGFICGTVKYLEISGFEIQGPNKQITKSEAEANRLNLDSYYKGRGIAVWASAGGHHINIHSNKIYDCPSSGIRINNSDYCVISNNEVFDCTTWTSAGESAIVLAKSKNFDTTAKIKMRITKNRVYNNQNMVRFYSHNFSCTDPTAYGCIDYPNIIDGSGCYITNNNESDLGGNGGNPNGQYLGYFYFANNVAYGNGINGIVVHNSDNAIVINNTCYINGSVPISEGRQNAVGITVNKSKGVRLYNNIVWTEYNTDYGYQTFGTTSDIVGANNMLINGMSNISGITDMLALDPLFEDKDSFNFKLTKDSPAIDAGVLKSNITALTGDVSEYEYTPFYDYENNNRAHTITDIGAYEFIDVGGSLSLDDINNFTGQINLYPNPATNAITLSGVSIGDRISIYDLLGKHHKTVKNIGVEANKTILEINLLKPGVYLLKISNNNGSKTIKLIKQ